VSRPTLGAGAEVKADALEVIEAEELLAEPMPERSWHVPNMIPGNDVTLLSSDGAVGKTTLGMQLANATWLGMPWLERNIRAGPAIYVTAEEPKSELRIRLGHIVAPFVMPKGAPQPYGLTFVSLATQDAVLVRFDRVGVMTPTPLFQSIERLVRERRPNLLVLDASADMFAGSEIDRTQVRNFIGLLRKVAVENDCAVVLLSHPSLEGLKSGRGHSGSTHWHNSVRSRWYLTTAGDKELDADLRALTHMKNNRGRLAEPIMLRWKDGYFRVEHGAAAGGAMAQPRAKAKFVELLAQYTAQGRDVSDKPGHAYAPKIFADDDRADGITKATFAKAMNSLFADKRLRVEVRGPKSRAHRCLVEVSAH
jgi:RecA-family ATPase